MSVRTKCLALAGFTLWGLTVLGFASAAGYLWHEIGTPLSLIAIPAVAVGATLAWFFSRYRTRNMRRSRFGSLVAGSGGAAALLISKDQALVLALVSLATGFFGAPLVKMLLQLSLTSRVTDLGHE